MERAVSWTAVLRIKTATIMAAKGSSQPTSTPGHSQDAAQIRIRLTMTPAEDFSESVAGRQLRGSIIVTSNRPPADWLTLFPDPVMANSALDRLAHNAHHFVMKGESYRKKMRPNSPAPTTNQTEHTEGQTAQ